jgi:hypothetical protein
MSEKERDPVERARLAKEAMRVTQTRADLLRRNDELLKKMLRCPERYRQSSKAKRIDKAQTPRTP